MRAASRSEEVLAVIVRFRSQHGISPTVSEVRELMRAPRVSLPMVVRYLDQLERGGRLSAVYASGKRSPRSLYPLPPRQLSMWDGCSGPVGSG